MVHTQTHTQRADVPSRRKTYNTQRHTHLIQNCSDPFRPLLQSFQAHRKLIRADCINWLTFRIRAYELKKHSIASNQTKFTIRKYECYSFEPRILFCFLLSHLVLLFIDIRLLHFIYFIFNYAMAMHFHSFGMLFIAPFYVCVNVCCFKCFTGKNIEFRVEFE